MNLRPYIDITDEKDLETYMRKMDSAEKKSFKKFIKIRNENQSTLDKIKQEMSEQLKELDKKADEIIAKGKQKIYEENEDYIKKCAKVNNVSEEEYKKGLEDYWARKQQEGE